MIVTRSPMKFNRRLPLLCILWLAVSPLPAQLGTTFAEVVKNYGAAAESAAVAPATMAGTIRSAFGAIEVEFIGDHIRRITYRRAEKFTEDEIPQLLAANADLRTWQADSDPFNPGRAKTGIRGWRRSDRGRATLSRQGEGAAAQDVFVFTDSAFIAASLKLNAATKTGPAAATDHTLTWIGYSGTGDTSVARLIFDREDLGTGAKGLAALKARLAALPAKSVVKVVPYYGDPGGNVKRTPPIDLAELRALAAARQITLALPQAK